MMTGSAAAVATAVTSANRLKAPDPTSTVPKSGASSQPPVSPASAPATSTSRRLPGYFMSHVTIDAAPAPATIHTSTSVIVSPDLDSGHVPAMAVDLEAMRAGIVQGLGHGGEHRTAELLQLPG